MASYQYGGQALIEGVLMRGRHALAVALRHPDGSIVWATERLDLGLRARRALKLPFLRGLVVLYDTLVTGTRWLVRSATIQALALEDADDGSGNGKGKSGQAAAGTGSVLHTLLLTPSLAIGCAADGPDSGYTDPDASGGSSAATSGSSRGLGKGYTVAVGGMLLLSLVLGIGLFFLLPLFLAQATVGRVSQGFAFQLSEGVIRVAIFIGLSLIHI